MTLTHFLETNSRSLTLLQDYSYLSLSLGCLLGYFLVGWLLGYLVDTNGVDAFSFYRHGWNLGEAWKHHARVI
ncbi:hypothetical protein ACFX10_023975 [Malus domestica]